MASISINKKEETRYVAKIQVSREEKENAESKAIARLQQKLKIPGFRKGKVPVHIIQTRFAAEMADETIQVSLYDQLPEVAKASEHGLYSIAGVENLKMKKDGFSFDLLFDCLPFARVGKLKNVEIHDHIPDIKEADLEDEIRGLRRRYAEISDKDSDKVEKGDLVNLEIEIWVKDIPRGNPQKQQYIIGHDKMEEDLEAGLLAERKAGDEFTLKKSMSDDEKKHFNANLKEGESPIDSYEVLVRIREVKKVILPDFNDEFAAKVDPKVKTAGELRESIRTNLDKQLRRRNLDHEIGHAIDAALEQSEVFYSDQYLNEKMSEYLSERKMDLDKFGDDEKKEFTESYSRYLKRKILVEHFITESYKGDKKGEGKYRDQFEKFLVEEYGDKGSAALLHAYDLSVEGRKVDQTLAYLLEKALGDFHQILLEMYFRKAGVIKKGKKLSVADMVRHANHDHAH